MWPREAAAGVGSRVRYAARMTCPKGLVLTHKYLHLKTQNPVIMEFHKRSALHGAPLESVVDAIVLAMDAGPTDPVSVDR